MLRSISLALALLLAPAWAWANGGTTVVVGQPMSNCSPSYGAETVTGAICTAPNGTTEGNATTGWTNSGCVTFDSDTTAPSLGTYHLRGIADANGDKLSWTMASLSAGTIYRMSVKVRHAGSGGNWNCNMGQTTTSFSLKRWPFTSADTTYQTLSYLFLFNTDEDVFTCVAANATNDGGVYLDEFSIKTDTPCLGAELHTAANAASLTNEANATTGWNAINSLNSLVSDATGPADGTYHILADATTNPAPANGINIDLGAAPFSLVESTKYFVQFNAKHIGSGDQWVCGFAATNTAARSTSYPWISVLSSETTYGGYGFEITYSAAQRYFVCAESGTNNNGGMYIDSFSVKAVAGE